MQRHTLQFDAGGGSHTFSEEVLLKMVDTFEKKFAEHLELSESGGTIGISLSDRDLIVRSIAELS